MFVSERAFEDDFVDRKKLWRVFAIECLNFSNVANRDW
jgi:hypothetical protein